MKYYEINEPYYALIKAENKKQAIKLYIERVSEDDGYLNKEIKEISRKCALCKVDDEKYLDGLDNVLLIDASLQI